MSPAAMPALRAALLGSPNCGKTTLFNLLTGVRQKVANYAGVTVERKEGWLQTASGRQIRQLDLPGTYSLHASGSACSSCSGCSAGRCGGAKGPR